nr:hypothetical protein [Streptomyces flavidovirens]
MAAQTLRAAVRLRVVELVGGLFGTDFFSHLAQHPELSAQFNAAMSQAVSETAAALPRAFDFGRFTTVTDG